MNEMTEKPNEKFLSGMTPEEKMDLQKAEGMLGSAELLNENAIDMDLVSPHDVHEAPESLQ